MKTKNYIRLSFSVFLVSGLSMYNVSGQPQKPSLPKPGPKDTLHHVKNLKIHAELKSVHIGDTLILKIDAPVSSLFKLSVFAKKDSLIYSLNVTGGVNVLPSLLAGHYHYKLVGDSGVLVKEGSFEVRAPKPPKPLEVKIVKGDTLKLWIGAPGSTVFTLNILTHKDSLIKSLAVSGGTNILPVLPESHYHYTLLNDSGVVVAKGKFDLPSKGPKPSHPKPLEVRIKKGDSLEFWIGAPLSESFILKILTHKDSVISIFTVSGGTNFLPALLPGHYHYELEGDSGVVVNKGKFDIHPPKVKSVIAPNPSEGDASITLDAPVTEKFELFIYSSTDIVSITQISGGTTQLPLLASGLYHYKVLDSNKNVVSKGRIIIGK